MIIGDFNGRVVNNWIILNKLDTKLVTFYSR